MTTDAQAVLAFWFQELSPAQWFKKDAQIDQQIIDRFGRYPHRNAVLGRASTPKRSSSSSSPAPLFNVYLGYMAIYVVTKIYPYQ